MKCISNFIILALVSVTTVFCAPTKVASIISDRLTYNLYNNGKASLVKAPYGSLTEITIPGSVSFNGKRYLVNEIVANAFLDKEVNKITIDSSNTGIRINENAFYGIRNLKEFNINSKYVEPEIGAFYNAGNNIYFKGSGIPSAVNRYSEKLLNKWDLPVGKNYKYVDDWDRMKEIFTLAKRIQETYNIYDKVADANSTTAAIFIGAGSSVGLSRVFRTIALVMGIPENEFLTGYDNIHVSWNYVKVDINKGKKWYVFDIQDKIGKNTLWNLSAFKEETKLVATLKKFYGSGYTINPNDFVILNRRYVYQNESSNGLKESENFNDWLKRTNGGERTLSN
ncbi:hypothetical protein BCR36DRAFT_581955 [Piromyces finnis]|uniref:Transglutaminase-like domain-containing protein n=1 Tax=Piromyces finnis TaxID=1754191 RepID=A0A1Y1VFV1_9FUNG|nr:hypothetical protein BCR36DRAFT_581955 [Piromyces finnis]|eukprot:ORX54322.1 hypothetical protein BCR36DRAFT_581955 [Piromyces finnis]